MKKLIATLFICVLVLCAFSPVYADGGKVTYSKNAGSFVFEPGSDYSLTDLFPDFKGVMPGDTLTQKITVKNNADDKVKVKIYMRSLGAHEDSREFLSMLTLSVQKSEENEMAYMFDAAASETAQLNDWVCLGTLYSGGEVNLDVTLKVPVELSNEFQNKVGYLDWEFMIEEFPIEPDDPTPPPPPDTPDNPPTPPTGDNSNIKLWIGFTVSSFAILIILLVWRKKDKKEDK